MEKSRPLFLLTFVHFFSRVHTGSGSGTSMWTVDDRRWQTTGGGS